MVNFALMTSMIEINTSFKIQFIKCHASFSLTWWFQTF